MVEPLHLLMFGATSITSNSSSNSVKLDDWLAILSETQLVTFFSRIPFTMSHSSVSLVGALRHAVDILLLKVAAEPASLLSLSPQEDAVLSTVKTLLSTRSLSPTPPRPGPGPSTHYHNRPTSSSSFQRVNVPKSSFQGHSSSYHAPSSSPWPYHGPGSSSYQGSNPSPYYGPNSSPYHGPGPSSSFRR